MNDKVSRYNITVSLYKKQFSLNKTTKERQIIVKIQKKKGLVLFFL